MMKRELAFGITDSLCLIIGLSIDMSSDLDKIREAFTSLVPSLLSCMETFEKGQRNQTLINK
jgi:hypothetical protein